MPLSPEAIANLRRLWVSPQPQHIQLAIVMSGSDADTLRKELLPECVIAKEFHPSITARLDTEDFLHKHFYGLEIKEWRDRVKFFHPPHQVYHYRRYEEFKVRVEHHFLDLPHLFEKYKEAAVHCSYSWGRTDKLQVGLALFERIMEKEPDVGDHYFFLGRCHRYLYDADPDYGSKRAVKAYRKAIRLKTSFRGQILAELKGLTGK